MPGREPLFGDRTVDNAMGPTGEIGGPLPTYGPRWRVKRRPIRRAALIQWESWKFFFGVVPVGVLVVLFAGPFFALLLLGAVLGYILLTRVPLEWIIPGVLFLVLALDNPGNRPADDMWKSPFLPLGKLLFENLKPLPFSALDLVFALSTIRAVSALVMRSNRGAKSGVTIGVPPRYFLRAALISLAAILWHEVHGVYGGGNWRQSLWQVRQAVWMPCLAVTVSAIITPAVLRRIERMVIWGAVVKAFTGLWFYLVVAKPHGLLPAYVGTHSDSVMYGLVLAMLGAKWFAYRDAATRRQLLWVGPLMFLVMNLNGRRIVWVGVAGALAYVIATSDRQMKRKLGTTLLAIAPLIGIYFAIGMKSNARVFYPAKMVNSVLFQNDRSSKTRDVENYNLFVTYIQSPVIGVGAGHEYVEYVVGDDISKIFPQYRYIPHNSYLGLWAFGGGPTASLYSLTWIAAVYCATASLKRSRHPLIRSSAQWAVAGIIAYLVQTFGDVGFQDWSPAIIAALCCGVAGGLVPLSRVPAEELA